MKAKTKFAAAMLLATAALGNSPGAQAASDAACRAYATNAVQQTLQMYHVCSPIKKSAEWSTKFNYHYDWCRRSDVTMAMLNHGRQYRASWINNCQGARPPVTAVVRPSTQRCNRYAEEAVRQTERMISRCRSSIKNSAEWSMKHSYHFNWCHNGRTTEAMLRHGREYRERVINGCSG